MAKSNIWIPIKKFNDNAFLMMVYNSDRVRYSPLYISSCKINNVIDDIDYKSEPIPYKLKHARLLNNKTQKEIANELNVSLSTIKSYENPKREEYPLCHLINLAKIYNISLNNLLDEYHMFLYKGQGQQINKLRKSFFLTQERFAEILKVNKRTILTWEKDMVTITKDTWKQIKSLTL